MIVYRFLRFGHRQEMEFDTTEMALAQALEDLNNRFAAPVEIVEDGKVLMDAGWIMRFHASKKGDTDNEQSLN